MISAIPNCFFAKYFLLKGQIKCIKLEQEVFSYFFKTLSGTITELLDLFLQNVNLKE
jgi:hypothetical protein